MPGGPNGNGVGSSVVNSPIHRDVESQWNLVHVDDMVPIKVEVVGLLGDKFPGSYQSDPGGRQEASVPW